MKLQYAHTCEYATIMADGKFVLVGIFDRITTLRPQQGMLGIALPVVHLAAAIECTRLDEGEKTVILRLLNEDSQPLAQYQLPIKIQTFDPTAPPYAQVRFSLSNLSVPDFGDYTWEFQVGDEKVGNIPLYIREHIPQPPAEPKNPYENTEPLF